MGGDTNIQGPACASLALELHKQKKNEKEEKREKRACLSTSHTTVAQKRKHKTLLQTRNSACCFGHGIEYSTGGKTGFGW